MTEAGAGIPMQSGAGRRAAVGAVIVDRYRLDELLGRGGAGEVWRAHDLSLDRQVAIKQVFQLPGADLAGNPGERARREAKAAARVQHPNVVRVLDVIDGDDLWLVMELVTPACSLASMIDNYGALTPEHAAAIGLGVLAGLMAAHETGVVHRDVKPSNVMIREDGRVVLTDFGIAQVTGDPSITVTGALVGSPAYMSPERAAGCAVSTASADIWSLGATLYAAVEGRAAFVRDGHIATMLAVLHDEPDLPTVGGGMGALISRMLAKDPANRPTAEDVRRCLQVIGRDGNGGGALPPVAVASRIDEAVNIGPSGATKLRRTALAGVLAAATLLFATGFFGSSPHKTPSPSTARATAAPTQSVVAVKAVETLRATPTSAAATSVSAPATRSPRPATPRGTAAAHRPTSVAPTKAAPSGKRPKHVKHKHGH